MKEDWNRKIHNKKTQNLPPPVYVHTIDNGNSNMETLKSRLEDIALQFVYNENRITKLELKIINESLLECKKANADIYQDAKIMQIENSVMKMSEESHFQQYFSHIVVVSFIGGGNWRTQRKPLTCHKSLTNLIR
jgi:hypothetical protein